MRSSHIYVLTCLNENIKHHLFFRHSCFHETKTWFCLSNTLIHFCHTVKWYCTVFASRDTNLCHQPLPVMLSSCLISKGDLPFGPPLFLQSDRTLIIGLLLCLLRYPSIAIILSSASREIPPSQPPNRQSPLTSLPSPLSTRIVLSSLLLTRAVLTLSLPVSLPPTRANKFHAPPLPFCLASRLLSWITVLVLLASGPSLFHPCPPLWLFPWETENSPTPSSILKLPVHLSTFIFRPFLNRFPLFSFVFLLSSVYSFCLLFWFLTLIYSPVHSFFAYTLPAWFACSDCLSVLFQPGWDLWKNIDQKWGNPKTFVLTAVDVRSSDPRCLLRPGMNKALHNKASYFSAHIIFYPLVHCHQNEFL